MQDHTKQGLFNWNELLTRDVEAAKKFYSEVLGWTAEDMPMGDMGTYVIFKADDEQVGGMMRIPPEAEKMGVPSYWGAYISVDDVDATAGKVAAQGGKVLVPPMDAEGVGRFATVQDPQGAVFGIIKSA